MNITSFIIALVMVGFLVEFIDSVNSKAAWFFTIIVVLGLALQNKNSLITIRQLIEFGNVGRKK